MKKLFLSLLALPICFFSYSQIKMNSTGNVGIGSVTPGTTHKLQVQGSTLLNATYFNCSAEPGNDIQVTSCGGYGYDPCITPVSALEGYLGTSGNEWYRIYGHEIRMDGDLVLTSDKSIKVNIRDYNNTLSRLRLLRAVQYDVNPEYFSNVPDTGIINMREKLVNDNKNKIGFIADELKMVYPELVDYNEESKLLGIKYLEMIPILVEAIKEQQNIIDSLSVELQSVKNQTITEKSTMLKSMSINPESTGAEEKTGNILFQNSPNPFSESSTIEYSLNDNVRKASIYIYDLQGKQLRSFDLQPDGKGSVRILGGEFAAGMYYYTLVTNSDIVDTKTMILTD